MKWPKKYILIMMFSLVNIYSFGQIDHIIWQRCLGTSFHDDVHTIERTETGYLIGISVLVDDSVLTNYHGSQDIWIVNIDTNGNTIWERCYGGTESDCPVKIINSNDGSFYLVAYSRSKDGDVQNNRTGDIWVAKIDSLGNIIWENSYGGTPNYEFSQDAILTSDGSLLILTPITASGGDISKHYGGIDAWICKIDGQGNLKWEKTYGNQGHDDGIKLKMTSDSTILLIGYHNMSGGMIDCIDYGGVFGDVWILEINENGDILNQWCYGGTYGENGSDIIQLEDGYAFVSSTGSNDGQVSGLHGEAGYYAPSDIWVVRLDQFGDIVWQTCLGGYQDEYPEYITQTEDGGFIVIGSTYSNDGDVSGNHTFSKTLDIWVVKLDMDGNLEWEHCFGGIDDETISYVNTIVKLSDYEYVIGGNSVYGSDDVECDLFGFPDIDAWIIEVDECSLHIPDQPIVNYGFDTICSTNNPASFFTIDSVPGAMAYEWSLVPPEAGTLSIDSLSSTVTWNLEYEGEVEIRARSYNECGYSGWSEPGILMLYSCLGLDESHLNKQIVVYPVPAKDRVVFEIKGTVEGKVFIYDIIGNLVEVLPVSSDETIWKTQNAPSGLYFFTFVRRDLFIPGKLVVLKE